MTSSIHSRTSTARDDTTSSVWSDDLLSYHSTTSSHHQSTIRAIEVDKGARNEGSTEAIEVDERSTKNITIPDNKIEPKDDGASDEEEKGDAISLGNVKSIGSLGNQSSDFRESITNPSRSTSQSGPSSDFRESITNPSRSTSQSGPSSDLRESLASPISRSTSQSAPTFSTDGSKEMVNNAPNSTTTVVNQNHVESREWTDQYGEKGIYTGEFSVSTNMPHGKGRMEYEKDKRWCEGDWVNGELNGNNGSCSNGNGDYYEGGFQSNYKHGVGMMKFADGSIFDGEYIRGQMNQGKLTYEDGSVYIGSFVDGMRHGKGKNVFADGSKYDGEFREGLLHGHGKIIWNDGGYYSGEWSEGEQHGRGKEIRPDGSLRHDGKWERGHPIRIRSNSERKSSSETKITTQAEDAVQMRNQRIRHRAMDTDWRGVNKKVQDGFERAKSLNNLGLVRLKQGMVEEAISLFLEAMRLDLRFVGAEHASVAVSKRNLGVAYEQRGELAAARDMYRHALRQQRSILGPQHEEVAWTIENIARVYVKERDFDRAIELLEESLEIKMGIFHAEHDEVIATSKMLDSARSRKSSRESDVDTTMEQRIDANRDSVTQIW